MSKENNKWAIVVDEADKKVLDYPSKSTFLDLESICQMMNAFFFKVFKDCQGSYLDVVPNPNVNVGGFIVTPVLYFTEPDGSKERENLPRAFMPITTQQYQSIGMQANEISRVANRQPRVFTITDEGREYITNNFIWHNEGDGIKYDYNKCSIEEPVAAYYGATMSQAVRVKAWGFDPVLIFSKIIKGINKDSVVVFTPVGTVPSSNPMASSYQNTLFKIDISTMEEYQKIGDKYRIGMIQNISLAGGPIITSY